MIANAARKLQRDIEAGKKQHVAMNDNLVQLVRAAKVSHPDCFFVFFLNMIMIKFI